MKKLLRELLFGAAMALVVTAPFWVSGPAHSATFKPIASGHSLVMTGEVVAGDAERLKAAYAASYRERGFAPERIFLNSIGGDVMAGFEVTDVVIETGMHTVVGATDTCASICTVVFAAGRHRVVFPTSRIGVHAASNQTASADGTTVITEDLNSLGVTALMARVLAALGAPDRVIVKTIITPGDKIAPLTFEDLAGWVEVIQ